MRRDAHWLPSRAANDPHGRGAWYRFVDGFRAGPICHLSSVRRVPGSKPAANHEPALTAKCRNLVDAASVTVRAENYLASVWREIGPCVPRAIESQTNRLAAGNLLDIEVHAAV